MKPQYLFILIFVAACQSPHSNLAENKVINQDTSITVPTTAIKLADKSKRFLWRKVEYDTAIQDTVSNIYINQQLCQKLSGAERAALGYVCTFVGSDCNYDGKGKEDLSNIQCKTITALGLGYQCSPQHLEFLRKWFSNDTAALQKLEDCPRVPFTASSLETFEYINLKVQGNTITIAYGVSGVNARMEQFWNYTQTDHFEVMDSTIKLVNSVQSKVQRSPFFL